MSVPRLGSDPIPADLDELEARLRHDLVCLKHPPANWVPERSRDGSKVVVGSTSSHKGGGTVKGKNPY